MGRTACTEPQCLYSTAIPLLPLCASVPVQYSYTSTPPMDRTVCTDPQCLYSRAITLLPLWTVRPVQSLSACTVELNLYSTYVPQCLFKGALYLCLPKNRQFQPLCIFASLLQCKEIVRYNSAASSAKVRYSCLGVR